jgi:hypothetical protein
MCRTAILTMALAAFAAGDARGVQAPAAKAHRSSPAAAQSAHGPKPQGAHLTATRAKSHSTTHAKTSSTRRRMRSAAGAKSRRQPAQRRTARRIAKPRLERVREASAPDGARAADSREETRTAAKGGRGEPPAAAGDERPELIGKRARQENDSTALNGAETTVRTRRGGKDADEHDEQAGEQGRDRKAGSEEASLHMPAPLRGSLASLERQNTRLDAEGLERIEDEDDLSARIANKLLAPVPASKALTVNQDLPENHRYCRPWTAKFLADLARAHEAAFHRPLEVSSAVRTVEYQKRLMETNGNAAAAEGDIVSPHLTGATVDIAKSGLTRQEIAWMRRRLAGLQAAGKIDVEEEFQQACFHITVYKSYAPAPTAAPGKAGKPGTGRQAGSAVDGQTAEEGL